MKIVVAFLFIISLANLKQEMMTEDNEQEQRKVI